MRDASARGIKITSKEKMFLNDSVSLAVKLPDGSDPLILNGRVVWIRNKSPNLWEAGVEFHKINLMEIQRIFRFADF